MKYGVICLAAAVVTSGVNADECKDVLSSSYNREYSSGSYASAQKFHLLTL
jgi:hypothetical protein